MGHPDFSDYAQANGGLEWGTGIARYTESVALLADCRKFFHRNQLPPVA